MKERDALYWARWLLLPCALWALAVVVPCLIAFITEYFLRSADYIFWDNADFWMSSLAGVLCGLAWVAVSAMLAPSCKLAATVASCAGGAVLAHVLMGESYYHVGSGLASLSFATRAPIYLCWWAGVAGLLVFWLVRRRRPLPLSRESRLPRGARAAVLVFAVIVLCALVVPSLLMVWRFALYHSALQVIGGDDEEKALRTVNRLVKVPLFDLDWTPGRILALIPFGFTLDLELFGCPTCRGIHTPLFHTAAARGHEALLERMLELRGSADYCGDKGQGALAATIRSHDKGAVALLLSRGVDAASTNVFGGGTFDYAVMTRAPEEIMDMLIQAGAPVNAPTHAGMTPLDCANIWEPDAIPFLVSRGATNAVVRLRMLPLSPGDSRFRFEGTDFGIRLPPGFSPINRVQTPTNCLAWKLGTVDRGSLEFVIGKELKPDGVSTNFNGFAAIASYSEYDWNDGGLSAHGSIAFESGYVRGSARKAGELPCYDAVFTYMAFKRRDLKRIRTAIQSFGRVGEQTE